MNLKTYLELALEDTIIELNNDDTELKKLTARISANESLAENIKRFLVELQ